MKIGRYVVCAEGTARPIGIMASSWKLRPGGGEGRLGPFGKGVGQRVVPLRTSVGLSRLEDSCPDPVTWPMRSRPKSGVNVHRAEDIAFQIIRQPYQTCRPCFATTQFGRASLACVSGVRGDAR